MKQLLLIFLMLPALLWAQDNPKYLTGAVPVENGKVVITRTIHVPSLSKDQVYDAMLSWADKYFTFNDSRVVYAEKADGDIAVVAENYLVFQSTALSLDRALMSYRMRIHCEDKSCVLTFFNIRYEYNVGFKPEPDKYLAETWVMFKYALNKAGTKLTRGNGKVREKTIDLIDNIYKDAEAALGIHISQSAAAETRSETVQPAQFAVAPASQAPAVITAPAATTEMAGYTALNAAAIPATLLQLLPESALQISLPEANDVTETAVSWKGVGNLFGKTIATIELDKNSAVYKQLENNKPFLLSFFKTDDAGDAWFIMECNKQGETPEGSKAAIMGEIINVWIK